MKIIILCDKADSTHVTSVLRLFRTLSIHNEAFTVGPRWRADRHRLDETLLGATHLVILYSQNNIASSWLSFVAGFSIGNDMPVVLYRPSRKPAQAPFLAPFFLVSSLEDLSSFFETERREWNLVNERREARRTLLDLGISFRGESFAEMVHEGNIHAVDLFLKAGLPLDTRDKMGVPLLSLAARDDNLAMVRKLLEAGASPNIQSEDRGNTPLMDAVALGDRDLVLELIEAGTDLNLKSKDEQTALIIAVGKNDVKMARALVEAGSDPDIADKLGFSARKYCKLFHNPEMDMLFTSPEEDT